MNPFHRTFVAASFTLLACAAGSPDGDQSAVTTTASAGRIQTESSRGGGTPTCGFAGLPACTSGIACNGGTVDEKGECVSCGAANEPVCTSDQPCKPETVAVAGVCVPCDGAGEPACCAAGSTDLGVDFGCVSCGAIATSVQTQAQAVQDAFGTDNQILVSWTVSPPAPVLVSIASPGGLADEYWFDATTTSVTEYEVNIGVPYTATVRPFGYNSNYCTPTTGAPATVGLDTITWTSPVLYPYSGDGYATLTLSNDGTWTWVGTAHDSGAFGLSYTFATGIPLPAGYPVLPVFIQTGSVGGTFDTESRDSNFSQSGQSDVIAANWLVIKQSAAHFNLSLRPNLGDAIEAALTGLSVGIVNALADWRFCPNPTTSGSDPQAGPTSYDDSEGNDVEINCSGSGQ